MPRPPPPATALISTGKPIWWASSIASASLPTGPSLPGTVGMPSSRAVALATILSPIRRMCSGDGPMKMKPCSSTIWAKSAFSERKP